MISKIINSINKIFNKEIQNNEKETSPKEEGKKSEENKDLFYGPFNEFSIQDKSALIKKAIYCSAYIDDMEIYYFVRSNLTQNNENFIFHLTEEDEVDYDGFYLYEIKVNTNLENSAYNDINDIVFVISINNDFYRYINENKDSVVDFNMKKEEIICYEEDGLIKFLCIRSSLIDDILSDENEQLKMDEEQFATFYDLSKEFNYENSKKVIEFNNIYDYEIIQKAVNAYLKDNNLSLKNLVNNKIILDKKFKES